MSDATFILILAFCGLFIVALAIGTILAEVLFNR